MKNWRIIITSLIPLALIGLEIYLLRLDLYSKYASLIWLLGIFTIILLLLVIFLKKGGVIFKQSILVVVRGGAASIPGIILLIYFLIHLGWITDQIMDFFKSATHSIEPFISTLLFLFMAFLADTLFIAKKNKEIIDKSDRKVFITALSKIKPDELKTLVERDFDAAAMPWNWAPIKRVLDNYENIEELILILSKEVNEALNKAKLNPGDKDAFQQFFEKNYPNKRYSPIYVHDIDTFDVLYDELKIRLNKRLREFDDHQILFGISSGTATMTASLIFLSMPGKRGAVYQKQDGSDQLDEFTVGILTIEELWDEIFEKYSKE